MGGCERGLESEEFRLKTTGKHAWVEKTVEGHRRSPVAVISCGRAAVLLVRTLSLRPLRLIRPPLPRA